MRARGLRQLETRPRKLLETPADPPAAARKATASLMLSSTIFSMQSTVRVAMALSLSVINSTESLAYCE